MTSLRFEGDPILAERCEEVLPDEDLGGLIKLMRDTMKKYNGIGLAAPQVGVAKRLFVMGDHVFINPKIVRFLGKKYVTDEGCLSIPGQDFMVKRSAEIILTYRNRAWKSKTIRLSGLQAQCVQHEIDHLNGILCNSRHVEIQ